MHTPGGIGGFAAVDHWRLAAFGLPGSKKKISQMGQGDDTGAHGMEPKFVNAAAEILTKNVISDF